MSGFKKLFGGLTALALFFAVMQMVSSGSNAAVGAVRINAGGPAVTAADGTTWSGCTSLSACSGYVTGGFAWNQTPAPTVSAYASNTTAAMHTSEWTGGQTNGIANGATAFAFNIPVSSGIDYQVILHFTELNKSAVGQRVFDVKLNNSTVLSNFDIFKVAGGALKSTTQTFNVHQTTSTLNLSFIRRVENAKVDAIEVVPVSASTTTTSITVPATTTTSTSTVPTTSTTTAAPVPTSTNVKWTTIASPPFRSAESSGGIINNKFYLFGGFQPASWYVPTASAAVYDIATNKWSSLPSAPFGITHAARVIDGNSFILAGAVGFVDNKEQFAVNKVLRFDTTDNSWSYLPDLPAARGSMGAALIGRDLHVFGGIDVDKNSQGDHWVLNLDNPDVGWRTETPFPAPRSHFAAVVVNGTNIYSVGGMTGWENNTVEKKDVYRYDTLMNTWTRMTDMPAVRSHVSEATMVIGDNIWMFGGEPKYPNASNEIYVYNLATDKWKKAASTLPQARFAGVADHIGNTVWYINGTAYDSTVWRGTIS